MAEEIKLVTMILNYILIIAALMIIRDLGKKYNNYLKSKASVAADTMIRDTKYNEDEIMKHLDYIINEALSEYVVFNINPQNVFYINSKLENEIVEHLTEEIPKRLSPTLLTQLSMIYNDDYIGTFLGRHIYLSVVDYVLSFNVDHENVKKETSSN